MLPISSAQIAEVIILARDMDRGEAELDAFIGRLAEDQQAALVTVFWVGRGSFDAQEVDVAYQTALREASVPAEEYLKGSPHLADHLEAGMEALGFDAMGAEDDLYEHR